MTGAFFVNATVIARVRKRNGDHVRLITRAGNDRTNATRFGAVEFWISMLILASRETSSDSRAQRECLWS
jgi:hypothetical protein